MQTDDEACYAVVYEFWREVLTYYLSQTMSLDNARMVAGQVKSADLTW